MTDAFYGCVRAKLSSARFAAETPVKLNVKSTICGAHNAAFGHADCGLSHRKNANRLHPTPGR